MIENPLIRGLYTVSAPFLLFGFMYLVHLISERRQTAA